MKNRKLFAVATVIFLLIAFSIPFLAKTIYDPDNGAVIANSWTYWDSEQPETSIPYLDVWTNVWNFSSNYNIYEITTNLYQFGSACDTFYNYSYGTHKNIHFPVPAADANLYSSEVTHIIFQ